MNRRDLIKGIVAATAAIKIVDLSNNILAKDMVPSKKTIKPICIISHKYSFKIFRAMPCSATFILESDTDIFEVPASNFLGNINRGIVKRFIII